MTPEIDVVTDPSFISDLETRPMDELRAVRGRCQALENSLSYVRRLIQGRFDIVGGELQRRREGGDAGDTGDLIGRLPDILSDRSRTSGNAADVRPPHSLDPDAGVAAKLEAMLEEVIASDRVGAATELADEELVDALGGLRALEDRISDERRSMHKVIDAVQAEVVRRYSSGEASVDTLLNS